MKEVLMGAVLRAIPGGFLMKKISATAEPGDVFRWGGPGQPYFFARLRGDGTFESLIEAEALRHVRPEAIC